MASPIVRPGAARPREAWEAESCSERLLPERSCLHPARRRRPLRLGGSALSAIDHPNSFRYFLSHLLFKKILMFSIIHLSQKIIDRARNENLSHILRSAVSRKGHISRSSFGSPYLSCPLPRGLLPQPALPTAPRPELCPHCARRVWAAQLEKRRGSGHHPGLTPAPRRSLYQPGTGWSPAIARSSWSYPQTWDPSTPILESHNRLQSEPFWKPEDPTGIWRPAQPLGARPAPCHDMHSPPCKATWGLPREPRWRVGHYCSFLLPEACPSSSWSLPCEVKGVDKPARRGAPGALLFC